MLQQIIRTNINRANKRNSENLRDKNHTNDEVERLKIKVTDFIVSQSTKDIDKYSKKFSRLYKDLVMNKEE